MPREQAEAAGLTTGEPVVHASAVEFPLNANVHSTAGDSGEAGASLSAADDNRTTPSWLRRLERGVFVLVCMQLGLMLVVLPWYPVWNMNVLLANFPWARAIVQSYFVRGLVTGLGIVDIWLGISEAVHYREQTTGKKTSGSSSPSTAS